MPQKYKPINCDFHELLLAKATLKEECNIVYSKKGEKISLKSIIVDVFTKKSEEFMVLKSGETIRLDKVISINNEPLPKFRCTF